jgi:hypothetical protein
MSRSKVILPFVSLCVAFCLTACATAEPDKKTATTAKDPAVVFDCALSLASTLGYTPEQVNRSSGFFEATRTFQRRFDEPSMDSISFLTFKDGQTVNIQVTATSKRNIAKRMQLIETSEEATRAAAKILDSCK